MSTLSAYNYSLLSVPAVWVLGIGTHWHAILLSARSKEIPKFDNVAPRQFRGKIAELAKASRVSLPAAAVHRRLRGLEGYGEEEDEVGT